MICTTLGKLHDISWYLNHGAALPLNMLVLLFREDHLPSIFLLHSLLFYNFFKMENLFIIVLLYT